MGNTSTKPFWLSTNFALAALTLLLSIFGGSMGLANQVVMAVVGLVAAFGAVRQFLPSAKFIGWRDVLTSGNTWSYLANVLVAVGLPNVDKLIPAFQELAAALIDSNWGRAISALITLVTMLWYIFTGAKK